MSEWFAALSTEQQIYYSIGMIATFLVVVQTLMMLVVGDAELADAGDADMGGPSEHPSGIALISSRTIVAFLMGFGWTGVIANRDGMGDPAMTAVSGVIVGCLFAYAVFRLMSFLYGLRDSGTLDYHNALGEVGTVYLPIPAAMAGPGRIQVMVQGRLKEIVALTPAETRLENRAKVRVVEVLDDNTLVVEPLNQAPTEDKE